MLLFHVSNTAYRVDESSFHFIVHMVSSLVWIGDKPRLFRNKWSPVAKTQTSLYRNQDKPFRCFVAGSFSSNSPRLPGPLSHSSPLMCLLFPWPPCTPQGIFTCWGRSSRIFPFPFILHCRPFHERLARSLFTIVWYLHQAHIFANDSCGKSTHEQPTSSWQLPFVASALYKCDCHALAAASINRYFSTAGGSTVSHQNTISLCRSLLKKSEKCWRHSAKCLVRSTVISCSFWTEY